MALISPFYATIFNNKKFKNLAPLLAPPYDVISPKLQKILYKRHKFNIVRAILPEKKSKEENVYESAFIFLKECEKNRIIIKEKHKSIYILKQTFKTNSGEKITRQGIICLVKLEEYKDKIILPHEVTDKKNHSHCLNLLISCKTEFNPIFAIYSDSKDYVNNLIKSEMNANSFFCKFNYENDSYNELWQIKEGHITDMLSKFFKGKKLYIADGHHRYEAALKFSKINSNLSKTNLKNNYNFTLMYLTSMQSPGLQILPTHRIIRDMTYSQFLKNKKIKRLFAINKLPIPKNDSIGNVLKNYSEKKHVFGLYAGNDMLYILILKNDPIEIIKDKNVSNALKDIDTYLFEKLILKNLLEDVNYSERLIYSNNENEILEYINKNPNNIGIFLNPLCVKQVEKICLEKELLPPKSTYFYPKLLSGLIMRKYD